MRKIVNLVLTALLWINASQALSLTIEKAEFGLIAKDPYTRISGFSNSINEISRWDPRALPDYWDIHGPRQGGQGWYRMQFELDAAELSNSESWAIYVPKHSRTLELYLNRQRLGDTGSFGPRLSNNWLHPQLFVIADGLLKPGQNQIHIRLAGYDYDATLSRVYVDLEKNLVSDYRWRLIFHPGVAQFSFVLMLFLSLCMAGFWLLRRSERTYLYISLFCLTAAIYSCDRFMRDFPFDIASNTYSLLFSASISLNTFFIVLFVHRFLRRSHPKTERYYLAIILASYSLGVLYFDIYQSLLVAHITHSIDGLFGLYVLVILYRYRHQAHVVDIYIVLFIYSLAFLLNVHDFLLRVIEPPHTDINFLQWTPVLLSASIFWLVFSRLIRTLENFEHLNSELNQRVAEHSAQVVQLEKQRAIDTERRRIMFDLHDGIGAQLINALNYLKRSKSPDPVLEPALSQAMQELRLMIDTMDGDSYQVFELLGIFRDRYETLLTEQNIRLDWNVDQYPDIEFGPTEALDFLRILQECMSNIAKHSETERVSLTTSKFTVEIQDYGIGIADHKSQGLGLKSMKQRAERIQAKLEVFNNAEGTQTRIQFRSNTEV